MSTEKSVLIPDLQSSIVCDDVRQERNGKFILIGIFDAIMAPALPLTFARICMVNRWCGGEGVFMQLTRLLKPDQKTVLVQGKEIPVRLPDAEATATNIEFFINVTFDALGTYWVEILLGTDLKLRYPLRVTKPPHPPPVHSNS